MKEKTGTVTCNGYDVFFRMVEGNSDTAVVCIHGAAGDSRLFTYQLTGLGKEHTVIAVDLPGHGQSGSPGVLTVEDYRDAVLAVSEKITEEKIVFLGHSMGGGVLFELYRKIPSRIAGLVFISTAPELPVNDMILDFVEKDFNSFCKIVVDLTYSPEAGEPIKNLAVNEVRNAGPVTVKNDFTICKNYAYKDLARVIDVPVLLLTNKKDKMVPASCLEEFKTLLPGAVLKVYDARGHLPYLENPHQVNNDITAFIQTLA